MTYKVILQQYENAVYNKDVEKFISIYDINFSIYDTWNEWVNKDMEALKTMAKEWFDSLGKEKVRVEFTEVSVLQSEDQIVWIGEVKFYALGQDNQILRSISNRWTWVIKNNNGELKIVHEHSSLPINIETFMGKMKIE